MINILIADNHTLVRKGVQALLAHHPDLKVVAEAETYEESLEQLKLNRVDLVLLDISIPVPASARRERIRDARTQSRCEWLRDKGRDA